MGGRQANQDHKQADGAGRENPQAPPEKTGKKTTTKSKPR